MRSLTSLHEGRASSHRIFEQQYNGAWRCGARSRFARTLQEWPRVCCSSATLRPKPCESLHSPWTSRSTIMAARKRPALSGACCCTPIDAWPARNCAPGRPRKRLVWTRRRNRCCAIAITTLGADAVLTRCTGRSLKPSLRGFAIPKRRPTAANRSQASCSAWRNGWPTSNSGINAQSSSPRDNHPRGHRPRIRGPAGIFLADRHRAAVAHASEWRGWPLEPGVGGMFSGY